MKNLALKIGHFAKEKTNMFIVYLLITSCILFYFGFQFGRYVASL